jgi:hypothetical protein
MPLVCRHCAAITRERAPGQGASEGNEHANSLWDFELMRHGLIRQAAVASWAGQARAMLVLAATAAVLTGCSGAGGYAPSTDPNSTSLPTIGDRFNQLFGSKAQAVGEVATAPDGVEPDCPVVKIRAGASTYAVAPPGKQPTITRTARDCTRSSGQIVARIGIQGRVIAGPAGAPPTVEIPLRVAVVQVGVNERVISTKVYRTTVSMAEDSSVPFSLVGEDLTYTMPPNLTSESFVFYIGFDPQALTPEPKPSRRK